MSQALKNAVERVNEYFFDVEETGGATDWTSALIYYGLISLSFILAVVFGTLTVLN